MPGEVLPVLSSIFNPAKLFQAEADDKQSVITIREASKGASLKALSIVSVGAKATGLKFDLCGFPGDKLFKQRDDMQSACDAIIFCQFQGEGYILCCELKSSEPKRKEIEKQLRSAHCFLDYIESVLKNYHKLQIDKWKRRYFLFHDAGKTPVSKPPLIDHATINDKPEKALFIPVKNEEKIYLRKLLGKPS